MRLWNLEMQRRWGGCGCFGYAAAGSEALASVPVGEGSRCCIGAM
jgi:hypothetical protein